MFPKKEKSDVRYLPLVYNISMPQRKKETLGIHFNGAPIEFQNTNGGKVPLTIDMEKVIITVAIAAAPAGTTTLTRNPIPVAVNQDSTNTA